MLLKSRKKNRLADFDYSQNGYYFVTICTHNREHYFGEIKNDQMVLSDIGAIVEQCWHEIPNHFPATKIDAFVIMPNHVHGIVIIDNERPVGNADLRSLPRSPMPYPRTKMLLPKIIHGLKSSATRIANRSNLFFAWQKSYYDHIIQSETALTNIQEYIENNPLQWALDIENEEFRKTVSPEKQRTYYKSLFSTYPT